MMSSWTVAAVILSVLMSSAQATRRPYTVEDHLALEQIASARSGRSLVAWGMSPPYREIGYYGNGSGVWEHAGAALYIAQASSDRADAAPLFEAEPGASYLLQSISPDERFVVYCRAQGTQFALGVHDRQSSSRRTYDLMPATGGCEEESLLWSSPEEFLMLASAGQRPPASGARPYTGKKLAEAWESAWAGGLAVDVQDSGAAASGLQPAHLPRLVMVNARTGAVVTLASGQFDGLTASPTGRFVAATRPGGEGRQAARCDSGGGGDHELVVFDMEKASDAVFAGPQLAVASGSLNWSTTDDRLAFFACSEAGESMRIYGWDAAAGSLTSYLHSGLDLVSRRERGLYQQPERFVWIGDRLAVYARRHDGDEAKFTPRNVQLFGGEGQLPRADWYLLGPEGEIDGLTSRLRSPSPFVLSATDDSMTVVADDNLWSVRANGEQSPLTAFDQARLELPLSERFALHPAPLQRNVILIDSGRDPAFLLVDTSTGRVRRVRSPAPTAEYIASAFDAGAVLFRLDDGDGTRLVLAHENGSSTVLRALNRHLAEIERTEWQTVSYEVTVSGKPQQTRSCILFPPGFEPGRKYPVIVEVYPTRRAHCTDPSWQKFVGIGRSPHSVSAHLLAGQGYIVFQPNAAAELIRAGDNPIGGLTSVVEQGVQELVERGLADPARVGLMGFSQGGLASLWVATQSSMFAAVVSLNGWSDLYTNFYDSTYHQSFYADQFQFDGSAYRYLPSVGGAFAMGRSPHADAQAYVSASPLHHADKVSAPVLLIHSDMDMFPLHQYERMYAALRHHGHGARLLRYWGEGHAPSSPENIRHMWGQIFDWFERHLPN